MDGIEPERAKFCENLAATKVETISHEATDASSKQRIMFPRVLKKNVVRPSPITETIQENVQNVIGNMCQQCNRTRCQCSAKAKEKVLISTQNCLVDPFVHYATKAKNGSEPLNSTEISDLVHDVQTGTSKAQPTTFETYLLTLTPHPPSFDSRKYTEQRSKLPNFRAGNPKGTTKSPFHNCVEKYEKRQ